MTKKAILISASGPDQAGITAKLTELIAQNQGEILDIGQSVLNGFLSLSILVSLSEGKELLKDMLFEGQNLNLNIKFSVVDLLAHEKKEIKKSYIISCIHEKSLPASYISHLTTKLSHYGLNIKDIHKTSQTFRSIDLICHSQKPFSSKELKEKLIALSHEYQVDIAFQKNNHFRWNKRLIVFDMDSTLIQTEVVNEIAKIAGVGDQVAQITEKAMNGELDFTESLTKRVALFEGLSEEVLQSIAQNLPITPGVRELIKSVKALGYKLAVISGGFTYFANHLKEQLNLDYAFANELEIIDHKLTGRVKGTIVDAGQKAILLDLIAQQESISREQTVAVGDGANDLPMLAQAGLGIAFHAKPYVKKRAAQQVSHGNMDSLIYFLGIHNQ